MLISGGSRSRLPLQCGRDQRPVGRIEFASLAPPPVPGHHAGPGAYANRLGKVADFRVGARLQARVFSHGVTFENIFLPPSGPRLTSISRAPQFDNLTKRGKAIDMPWSVRDRF